MHRLILPCSIIFILICGCGDDGDHEPVYSCDFYSLIETGVDSGEVSTIYCYEFTDTDYEKADQLTFKEEKTSFEDDWVSETAGLCADAGGLWGEEKCPRDAAIGACNLGTDDANSKIAINAIVLTYPPITPEQTTDFEELVESCSDQGGSYTHGK